MSQEAWGLVAICLASIRLLFLGINGAWRPSAHIRALGAFFSSLIWSVLLMASLGTSPTVGVYLVLLALDVFSIWFAAGDAKLADLKARE